MAGILIAGTASDAGKTVVVTGLCRALARRGMRVAPYKALNMSNNSMVCVGPDGAGAEISRAQWIQAHAARVAPEPAMNPVLVKPGAGRDSPVVLLGRPWCGAAGSDGPDGSGGPDGRAGLAAAAHAAYRDLAARYDVVVAEGAGSPAEINLRAGDYANMGLARHDGLPVLIVGDIDRGGVFAAFLGTVALLAAEDQALVAGFIVNKFRGEPGLLAPGLRDLERLTGRRVFGTLPWHPDLWLDAEDALDLAARRAPRSGTRRVVVIRLPRISNFTDVDALGIEPDLDVVFTADPRGVADADLVVLPGTRATIADLAWLRSRGLDSALLAHAAAGRPVLGICGGFQMLGRSIRDPGRVESDGVEVDGLGLLDVETRFAAAKVLRLPTGTGLGVPASGYEVHHGRVVGGGGADEFPGGVRAGRVFGTMWHGALEGDELRGAFLREALDVEPSGVSFPAARERRLDLLADLLEQHVDITAVADLVRTGPPAGLPFLPPGAPV